MLAGQQFVAMPVQLKTHHVARFAPVGLLTSPKLTEFASLELLTPGGLTAFANLAAVHFK
jgi:hypothetical protein